MKNGVICINRESLSFTRFKKHFCSEYGTKVKPGYNKNRQFKIPRSKNYDFSLCDTFLIGDVKFITRCLYYPECKRNISFKEKEVRFYETSNYKRLIIM